MSNKLYSPLIQDPVTKQFYKHELNTHTGIVLKTQQKFINNLIKERDQYKAERDTLIDDIAVLKANGERYRKRAENAMDYAERSQCEVMRLERENEKLVWTLKNKEDVIDWNCLKIRDLKEDVEKYKRGISNLINENELKHNLLYEFSQHIGNKPSSSTYKYFRAKLDELGIEEGE